MGADPCSEEGNCQGDACRSMSECHGDMGACSGCSGTCPHAEGNEFVWDYDDTVLVFSSDMLEEEDSCMNHWTDAGVFRTGKIILP